MKYEICFRRSKTKDRAAAESDFHYENKFGPQNVVSADLQKNAPFLADAFVSWWSTGSWTGDAHDLWGVFEIDLTPEEIVKRLKECPNPSLADDIDIARATEDCELEGWSDAFTPEFIEGYSALQRAKNSKRAARVPHGPLDYEIYPAFVIVGRPKQR
jgi:hypothetical protein